MKERKFAVGEEGIVQDICPCFSMYRGAFATVIAIMDGLPYPFGTWVDHCNNERCYVIALSDGGTMECGDVHLRKRDPPPPATSGEDKIMDLLKNPIDAPDEIIHFPEEAT